MAELATKTIYLFDTQGRFIGADLAVESPAEPGSGNFLIPPNATAVPPPEPVAGKERVWTGSEWVTENALPPETTGTPESVNNARERRNVLLLLSDFTQLPDAPDWVDVQAWRKYRQQLRDVPQQGGFPVHINWPVAPNRKS